MKSWHVSFLNCIILFVHYKEKKVKKIRITFFCGGIWNKKVFTFLFSGHMMSSFSSWSWSVFSPRASYLQSSSPVLSLSTGNGSFSLERRWKKKSRTTLLVRTTYWLGRKGWGGIKIRKNISSKKPFFILLFKTTLLSYNTCK